MFFLFSATKQMIEGFVYNNTLMWFLCISSISYLNSQNVYDCTVSVILCVYMCLCSCIFLSETFLIIKNLLLLFTYVENLPWFLLWLLFYSIYFHFFAIQYILKFILFIYLYIYLFKLNYSRQCLNRLCCLFIITIARYIDFLLFL